jgi:hypothetical protein
VIELIELLSPRGKQAEEVRSVPAARVIELIELAAHVVIELGDRTCDPMCWPPGQVT